MRKPFLNNTTVRFTWGVRGAQILYCNHRKQKKERKRACLSSRKCSRIKKFERGRSEKWEWAANQVIHPGSVLLQGLLLIIANVCFVFSVFRFHSTLRVWPWQHQQFPQKRWRSWERPSPRLVRSRCHFHWWRGGACCAEAAAPLKLEESNVYEDIFLIVYDVFAFWWLILVLFMSCFTFGINKYMWLCWEYSDIFLNILKKRF